jgi:TolB-like protein
VAEEGGSGQGNGAEPAAPEAGPVPNPDGAVFISYASRDAGVATALVESLERHGIACWIAPRDVDAGAPYADSIVRAISGAKALVLVLSENSVASMHVSKEVERASSKRRPVIALRIDDAPLSPALEYFVGESHWIDARAGGMDAALAKLISAIRKSAPTAPGVVAPVTLSAGEAPAAHREGRRSQMLLATGLAVVAVAIGALLADKFWPAKHVARQQPGAPATSGAPDIAPGTTAIPDKSVAVLPFLDMSEKKDQEYFSDGLSEELIDMLTKIPDLRVPARTSSFYFKGKSEDIPTIARRLLVAHVLEGSVRKSGNHLRVTAQLVRADNGYHLWSETYDRELDDVFKVQDEIAAAVVGALKVSLIGAQDQKRAAAPNSDAYTLYLQGREISRHASTKADFDKAVEYFRRSLKADPTFADAWQYLMFALSDEVIDRSVKPELVSAEMRHAASEVNALVPGSAEAHHAAAQIYWSLDWNWQAATAEYRRVYELTPNDYAAVRQFADVNLCVVGDDTTALRLYQRAIELDPVADWNYQQIAYYYLDVGMLSEAESAIRKAIDLNPMSAERNAFLGQILIARELPRDALAAVQRESDESARRWGLALAYQALGRKADADLALSNAERQDADTNAYGIAEVHAYRGEMDQAFAWLERAYRQRDFSVSSIKCDPLLNNLKGDPRYKAFLRKMNLPE